MKFTAIFNVLTLTNFSGVFTLALNGAKCHEVVVVSKNLAPNPTVSHKNGYYLANKDAKHSINKSEDHPTNNYGKYPANNDEKSSKVEADPYYVWSPRPDWSGYSASTNDEERHSDDETHSYYSQQAEPLYDLSASQRGARYSSEEYIQLHS
ncbi:hypothetical protein CONCODRAFT_7571 [Conidiobolus coronatus NRRL 28638]|uniref:Uncharacterized protein n=1 Tax=Conidiobolus coronatus (strain ATCC 28846 / CBS 209.66 / NRRL 28638) TaxID=796925 RepID=A0A137P4K3_CONC2|nr:hypothetical protein CONCODRAFT_7571 [Conidiobolus coronatus NRRL 28638]|eukprot:KXN69926.1 hypothetical protein CONCODRAFT_7571 [Conidiobolus coronatus NRRL 28638]